MLSILEPGINEFYWSRADVQVSRFRYPDLLLDAYMRYDGALIQRNLGP